MTQELRPDSLFVSIFVELRLTSIEHHRVAPAGHARSAETDEEDQERGNQTKDPVAETNEIDLCSRRILSHERLEEPQRRTIGDQREDFHQRC